MIQWSKQWSWKVSSSDVGPESESSAKPRFSGKHKVGVSGDPDLSDSNKVAETQGKDNVHFVGCNAGGSNDVIGINKIQDSEGHARGWPGAERTKFRTFAEVVKGGSFWPSLHTSQQIALDKNYSR